MAWISELLDVKEDGKRVVATVRFSDDQRGEYHVEEIVGNELTKDVLAIHCQKWIEELENRNASFATFKDVPLGKIDLPRDVAAVAEVIK